MPVMAGEVSPGLYNSIPGIDDQVAALNRSAFSSVWVELCQAFIRHQAHKEFGVALLHRHLDLPSGYAMVHSWNEFGEDICRPEPVGLRKVFPSSYYLRRGRFLAFEFTVDPTPTPSSEFLVDVLKVLQDHQLAHLIAVVHVGKGYDMRMEEMLEHDEGTIATTWESDPKVFSHYATTEWAFDDGDGKPHLVALKACKQEDNGGHSRT